jgi:mannonate dehydratase
MKLGLGLYRHMLDKNHFAFARQCGCTHVVVHLVDYFNNIDQKNKNNQPVGSSGGWGFAGNSKPLWQVDELLRLKKEINNAGLELEAIENFDPADWYDILLDGPQKKNQIEGIKQHIRNIGKAGIPVIGYNFSLAGVCSRTTGPFARGGAVSVGMDYVDNRPVPNGMVWNMTYDSHPPGGVIKDVTEEELWGRLEYFLKEIIPVAEESGVIMAAHPDDPPMPVLRNTPRLIYQPKMYSKLLSLNSSKHNALEFCLGSIAEMMEGNVYEATEEYADNIAYIHFRNIKGKVPNYKEVFLDEGDIDMIQILKILKAKNFKGVLIPDHTPQMNCEGSWDAGMAYALGFMNAMLKLI